MSETRYAKIINPDTYEVQVGVGCDEAYYIEIGMTLMDVERAYNCLWYIAGHAPVEPEPTPEEIKKRKIEALKIELNGTDYKIIKCSEYQLAGITLPYDIAELHITRQKIRDEINQLEG